MYIQPKLRRCGSHHSLSYIHVQLDFPCRDKYMDFPPNYLTTCIFYLEDFFVYERGFLFGGAGAGIGRFC